MHEKVQAVASAIKDAADKVADTASNIANHEDTKAAIKWTKDTVRVAADEAVELGKRAARSDLAKDAATGAGIGAVVAVPVPLIGPALGAAIGAGAGVYMSLTKGGKKSAATALEAPPDEPRKSHTDQLLELDDLRQRGVLTQDEFERKKRDILNRM